MKPLSVGEETLNLLLRDAHCLSFCREYQFDAQRKWRFDFAWPDKMVAVEIEGRGRHQSVKGFADDIEKYNAAELAGWTVLRFTPSMVTKEAVKTIERVLCRV